MKLTTEHAAAAGLIEGLKLSLRDLQGDNDLLKNENLSLERRLGSQVLRLLFYVATYYGWFFTSIFVQ